MSMVLTYFGHHKCASQYIKAVFLQSTSALAIGPARVDYLSTHLPLNFHEKEPYTAAIDDFHDRLLHQPFQVLCLTNADMDSLALLEMRGALRGFHVIRDLRDLLVSAYFSHLFSHPMNQYNWIAEARQRLSAAPDLEAGLLMEIEIDEPIFQDIIEWNYDNPNIYETRYEILVKDPLDEFTRIFSFLGFKIPTFGLNVLGKMILGRTFHIPSSQASLGPPILPRPVLQSILAKNRFEQKSEGRRAGEENAHHHYRKGIAGDWKNYFTPKVSAAFKDRYGEMLIKLGYEANLDW